MLAAQPAGAFPGRSLGKIPLAGSGIGRLEAIVKEEEFLVQPYLAAPEKEFTPAWMSGSTILNC